MEWFIQDLRYAIRTLAKNKSFTLVVIIVLALGIGANTTIFTVLNAIFLEPLPLEKPKELVSLFTIDEKNSTSNRNFLLTSFVNYQDYRDQNTSFSGLLSFYPISMSLTGKGDPEQLNGLIVTGNYFDVLGVKATLGRTFLPEEDQSPGLYPVIVLGHDLWKSRFGSSPQIIGSQITCNAVSYTVIGVTPENFRGTFTIGSPDFFVPMMMYDQVFDDITKKWFKERRALLFNIVGRLKTGVTIEQAQAEIKILASQLEQQYPKDNENRSISLVPLTESSINPNQRNTFVMGGILLMVVVGLVLLIACANIANLLLIRANTRQHEIAIRIALGASQGRLLQQFMIENIMLSTIGGVFGLCLAAFGRDILWSYRPSFIQENDLNLSLDFRVLGFTLLISLLTGVIFAIVPTFQAAKPDLVKELKEKISSGHSANHTFSLRNILVIAQIAFSLISLMSASLFLQSLLNSQEINPGFETKKLLAVSFELSGHNYDEKAAKQFYQRIQERIGAVRGVKTAAISANAPLRVGALLRSVFPEGGDPLVLGKGILTITNGVSLKYFETLGIDILQGRDFNETDKEDSPQVCIINQAMANRFWPAQNAIGKRFKFFGDQEFTEVIGIAENTKQITMVEEPIPCVYLPIVQRYTDVVTLYVQSQEDPKALLGIVQKEIQSLDPNLPFTNTGVITDIIDQNLWAARMSAWLLSLFGILALMLASVGIYGVLAYSVNQRTQEIGIRMALGANASDVLKLVLSQAMILVTIGIGVGLLGGFFVTRLFSGLLFNVKAIEPITFLVTPLLLVIVAFIASYIPAYRATKVDPLIALRNE